MLRIRVSIDWKVGVATEKNIPSQHSGDWWHIDSKGRRIGWMWPEDFKLAIDGIWGYRQGIANFARYAGFSRTTIEQYCNGKLPVPKHVALLVMSLNKLVHAWSENQRLYNRTREFPDPKADWLPESSQNPKKGLASRPSG